jgi:hypothetical protein
MVSILQPVRPESSPMNIAEVGGSANGSIKFTLNL